VIFTDFADPREDARAWTVFTDRVMGGVSTARASLEMVAGRRALRLQGQVSLERNGGFVQMACALGAAGASLDASGHTGLALDVCGAPGAYFVHLRTVHTQAPWQHYRASLPVESEWRTVHVPWAAFVPAGLSRPLDPSQLTRLGVVAGKVAFQADVAVERVGLVLAAPERPRSATEA
jgi:hypothetical protein